MKYNSVVFFAVAEVPEACCQEKRSTCQFMCAYSQVYIPAFKPRKNLVTNIIKPLFINFLYTLNFFILFELQNITNIEF